MEMLASGDSFINQSCCEYLPGVRRFVIHAGPPHEIETLNKSSNESMWNFCQENRCDFSTVGRRDRFFSESFVGVSLFLYSAVLLVGVPGNVLTCAVIILRKHMRRSIHIYTFNLAVADLAILLVFAPTQMIFTYNQARWLIGSAMCSISNFFVPLNLFASIGTLVAISFDRHRGLTKPFKWRSQSLANAKRTIPIIWFISIGLAFPVFHFSKLDEKSQACWENWPSQFSEIFFWSVIVAIQYVIPLVIIVIIHLRMIQVMSRGELTIYTLHMRMVKMVIALLTVYAICNGMPHVMFFWDFFGRVVRSTSYGAYIFIVSNLLLCVQAAVNPFIYGATRIDFKQAYKSLIVALSNKCRAVISGGKKDGYNLTGNHGLRGSDAYLANSAAFKESEYEVAATPKLFRKSYETSIRGGNLAPPSMHGEWSFEKSPRINRLETLAFLNMGDLPKRHSGKRSSFRGLGGNVFYLRLLRFMKISQAERERSLAPSIVVTDLEPSSAEAYEGTYPGSDSSPLISSLPFRVDGSYGSHSPLHSQSCNGKAGPVVLKKYSITSESRIKTQERFSDARSSLSLEQSWHRSRRTRSDPDVRPSWRGTRSRPSRASLPHGKYRADTLAFAADADGITQTCPYENDVNSSSDLPRANGKPKHTNYQNVVLLSYRQSQIYEFLDNCPETNI